MPGLGAWEQDGLPSFTSKEAFDQKQIQPGLNGDTMSPDWEWWRKQMPYFLGPHIYKGVMNYLVISPTSRNFQQFTIRLANKGITVLRIGPRDIRATG